MLLSRGLVGFLASGLASLVEVVRGSGLVFLLLGRFLIIILATGVVIKTLGGTISLGIHAGRGIARHFGLRSSETLTAIVCAWPQILS